jgi:hypothetical protein
VPAGSDYVSFLIDKGQVTSVNIVLGLENMMGYHCLTAMPSNNIKTCQKNSW